MRCLIQLLLLPLVANAAPITETAALTLLKEKCAACHSGANKSSDFSIESPAQIIAGGKKLGRAIAPGHPSQSPLIQLLKGTLNPRMPLGGELSATEIATVEAWIQSLPPEPAPATQTEWRWPYEKPLKHTPPAVRNTAWPRNEIDRFILAKMESANIAPAPPAPKRTLARRLYLDLTGLPPSPEELDQFLNDQSPNATERLIDRLLASPRYGERWGRHWLDLARYAETSGLEGDGAIGNVWRYRDWVIDAFNSNMPYDKFVLQQIGGGDEHSKTRNNYAPDVQGHIPTAFLRVAPWDRSNLVAAEVRSNYQAEVTTATASVFLGLTVGCARCHDHKYDPIPQKDFYRFQAFFNATQADRGLDVPYKDPAMKEQAEAESNGWKLN